MASAFTTNKTWVGNPTPLGSIGAVNYKLVQTSSSVLTLNTTDGSVVADELDGRLSIEIRVYP